MKRLLQILLFLAVCMYSFGQIPRLHVEGRNIYDQNDSLVMLRGFNWGWWGEALPEDAGLIKNDIGANAVRLAFRWHYWGSAGVDNAMNARDSLSPGNIKPDFLLLLDDYIAWLSEEELWTILFINSDQGAGANEKHFFNTPYLKEEFLETWMFLAERYKETPYIAAFELMAEPTFERNNRGVSNAELAALYAEVADSINTITGESIPFVIGPQNYYHPDYLTDDYHLPGYQIIYAANMFKPGDYCRGAASYGYPSEQANKEAIESYYDIPLQFREKFNVPVWVDQWGASRLSDGYVAYTRDVIDFLERKELHWTYWNWRQYSGDRGIFERYPKWSGPYQVDTALYALFDSVLFGDLLPENIPPVIEITWPGDSSLIHPGEEVVLTIDASDSDGSIASVDLYLDRILVQTYYQEPYTFDLDTLSEGDYWFHAIATDDRGGQAADSIFLQVKLPISAASPSASPHTTLQIYPNPASSIVHFSRPCDFEIYTLTGIKVLGGEAGRQVDVSGLSGGLYIVKTEQGVFKLRKN